MSWRSGAHPPARAFARSSLRAGFLRAGFLLDQLEEDLVASDHPELASRAFLDGIESDLEVLHFRIQGLVARPQLPIGFALRADLPLHVPHAQPPALAQPEGILGKQYQPRQGEG